MKYDGSQLLTKTLRFFFLTTSFFDLSKCGTSEMRSTSYNVSHQRQVMGSAAGGSSGSQSPPLGTGSGPGGSGSWPTSVMNSAGGWVSVSPVELLVQRACDPSLSEPPYPVHVELAEYINTKKANTYVID